MKTEVSLNRTGGRRITFMGEKWFEVTNWERQASRWWRLEGYIVDGGYIVGAGHLTTWRGGERDHYDADEVRTKKEAIRMIWSYTPPPVPPDGTPSTLVKDWEKERNSYIDLAKDVEQIIKEEAKTETSIRD